MATPVTVPDDAFEDLPPDGETATLRVEDPEAKHRRGMDWAKLKFGIHLIAWCLGVYVLLTVLQHATQRVLPESASLTAALDVLKLVATTALGFVFGRTLDHDNRKSDES